MIKGSADLARGGALRTLHRPCLERQGGVATPAIARSDPSSTHHGAGAALAAQGLSEMIRQHVSRAVSRLRQSRNRAGRGVFTGTDTRPYYVLWSSASTGAADRGDACWIGGTSTPSPSMAWPLPMAEAARFLSGDPPAAPSSKSARPVCGPPPTAPPPETAATATRFDGVGWPTWPPPMPWDPRLRHPTRVPAALERRPSGVPRRGSLADEPRAHPGSLSGRAAALPRGVPLPRRARCPRPLRPARSGAHRDDRGPGAPRGPAQAPLQAQDPGARHPRRAPRRRKRGPLSPRSTTPSTWGRDQDVLETVRTDVERLLAAREPTSHEYLRLLPPKALRWRPSSSSSGARTSPATRLARRGRSSRRSSSVSRLTRCSSPSPPRCTIARSPSAALHSWPRDTELALPGKPARRREAAGRAARGPELAGKTELLSAWLRASARRAASAACMPRAARGSSPACPASASGRSASASMRAAQDLDALLYFENLGELLAQHSTESIDFPGAMKPSWRKARSASSASWRPSRSTCSRAGTRVLRHPHPRARRAPQLEDDIRGPTSARGRQQQTAPARPSLAADAVEPLVELAERYLPSRALPGKALRLYEEMRAGLHQERTGDGKTPVLTRERF